MVLNIVGGRILEVSAEKKNDVPNQGLEYNIDLSELKRDGKRISIVYKYVINYKPDLAVMKIKGELFFEMEEADAKKIEDDYKKSKIVPPEFAEEVLNASNYSSATIGTLLSFAIGVGAPLNLPRTRVEGKQKADGVKAS